MKKITFSFVLLLVLSFTVFAEGDIHTGGKTCPQNQNCLVQPEQTQPDDNPIISVIKEFLEFIF